MPQVVQLPKPPGLQAVMRSLGSPAHADALHLVARAGTDGLSVKQLSEALKCSRTHANRLLQQLEDDGFVAGDPAPGARSPRPGTPTRFTLNASALDKAIERYRAHVLGKSVPNE